MEPPKKLAGNLLIYHTADTAQASKSDHFNGTTTPSPPKGKHWQPGREQPRNWQTPPLGTLG